LIADTSGLLGGNASERSRWAESSGSALSAAADGPVL